MRESLERSESASSASSEQWILNYPMPDDPQNRMDQSGSVGPASRQSSVASVSRQDSSNSKSGVNCEEDRRVLEELLEKERAAQSKSESSNERTRVKQQESAEKKDCSQGSNLSLAEKSIMSDFVSSIMAEVKLEPRTTENSRVQRSRDDMVKHKKPSSQISRSQSMKVSSRPVKPERTRIPSGGLVRKSEDVVTSIPKPGSLGNKSAVSAKKSDVASTKSSNVRDKVSGIEAKKSGLTSPRTSFMPKVLTRTPKPSADSGTSSASGSEKSGEKSKKSNLKYGKGKSKTETNSKAKGASSISNAKDESIGNKDSGSKSKSKIPQLIRQGLKPSLGKADSNKKKIFARRDTGLQKQCENVTKSQNGECSVSCSTSPVSNSMPTNKRPSFVVENVPFIDDSARSPNPENKDSQASPPFLREKPPGGQDISGEAMHRPSPKLSPRLLQRLQASGIELANSSGSDNDSVFLHDDPVPATKHAEPSQPQSVGNSALADQKPQQQHQPADISALANRKSKKLGSGCGSELQLDQKEIEDIKNGLLVSDHDALSIGSWSAKSSEFGLKNTFLFGNGDFGNIGTPSSRSLCRGSISRGSIAPSMSSNPEEAFEGAKSEVGEAEEVEAKRYDVPLVSTDLMEDFEAEDLCEEDGMSSDREKEAQLSEKVREMSFQGPFE